MTVRWRSCGGCTAKSTSMQEDGGRGKQFPASKHHPAKTSASVVQLRLSAHIWLRWLGWLHWVVQCSLHYMSPAAAVRLVHLCHHQCCQPTAEGSQNGPPAQVIPPAAAGECLLLPGITRHMRGESPLEVDLGGNCSGQPCSLINSASPGFVYKDIFMPACR